MKWFCGNRKNCDVSGGITRRKPEARKTVGVIHGVGYLNVTVTGRRDLL